MGRLRNLRQVVGRKRAGEFLGGNTGLSKVLVICFVAVCAVSLLPPDLKGGGLDFDRHYAMARGEDSFTNKHGEVAETSFYPPLFRWIVSPFAFRLSTFYLVALFIICTVIPVTLFKITGNWVSALFYFSTTSLFYFQELGYYGQALAIALMVLVIYFKDYKVRVAIFVVSILAHSYAPLLVGATIVACCLQDSFNLKDWLRKPLPFLPVCSGWFPENRPDDFLSSEITRGASMPLSGKLNLGRALKQQVEIWPFPFLGMSLLGLWRKRQFGLILLMVAIFIAGFVEFRAYFAMPVPGIIGLTYFYEGIKSRKYKAFFWMLIVAVGVIQAAIWLRYKIFCFPL